MYLGTIIDPPGTGTGTQYRSTVVRHTCTHGTISIPGFPQLPKDIVDTNQVKQGSS